MRNPALSLIAAIALLTFCGCPSDDGGGGGASGPSLQERFQTAMNISSPTSRANQLIDVARDQNAAGDATGMRTSLDNAFAAASEGDDPAATALAFNGLAAAEAEFGSKSKAEEALKEARKAATKIEVASIKVEQLGAVAVTFGTKLGDTDKASSYLKLASDSASAIEDPAMRSQAIISLAKCYHQIENKEESAAMTDAAAAAAKEIEGADKQANAIVGIAAKVQEMGQGDKAQELCEEAVALAESSQDALTKANVFAEAALVISKSGDSARAQELIKKASTATDQISDPGLKSEAEEKVGRYQGLL